MCGGGESSKDMWGMLQVLNSSKNGGRHPVGIACSQNCKVCNRDTRVAEYPVYVT